METSTAQAKKSFYDYLDRERPWNKSGNQNMYTLMEEIVEKAALYFTGERKYSSQDMTKMEGMVIRLTENLSKHPDDYDGPCGCQECASNW